MWKSVCPLRKQHGIWGDLTRRERDVGTDWLQQELRIYSVRDGRLLETVKQGCNCVENRQ